MSLIPKLIYRFNATPIKMSVDFLELEQLILKLQRTTRL